MHLQPGEPVRFGGGATDTLLHPLVAVWMLIAIVLMFVLPRRKAITPFLLAFFTIPLGQVVVLAGVHFTALRILILAGLVRGALSGEASSGGRFPGGSNPVDRVVVLWSVWSLVAVFLQWMELQAFVKLLGDFLDALGAYLVVRYLIPDGEAVRRTIKTLAVICAIHAVCMINERITHVNVFGLLGGAPLAPKLRDGRIRAEGVLGTIQSGTFGGVLIPLFLWLWTEKKSRMAACTGVVGATAMVIASNTSTSLMAFGASLWGLAFWPLRKRMRLVRWGIVAMVVGLHLVMKGPVWSLIERIDLAGGSSSYHRYMLVDNCIRHFSDWWLLGCNDYDTWGFQMWDLCNQFVAVAYMGGLVGLVSFILIYSRSFGALGRARKQVDGDRRQEWFLWCLGATLFANLAASFGINYLAQLLVLLFPVLACISVATFETKEAAVSKVGTRGKLQLAPAPSATGGFLPLGEAR